MAESSLDQWYWFKGWSETFQRAVDTLIWLWCKVEHLRKKPFCSCFVNLKPTHVCEVPIQGVFRLSKDF